MIHIIITSIYQITLVSVIVLINVGITIPLNNTLLITLGSEIRLQEKRGRYDPVGITIPLNNTTLIILGREIVVVCQSVKITGFLTN